MLWPVLAHVPPSWDFPRKAGHSIWLRLLALPLDNPSALLEPLRARRHFLRCLLRIPSRHQTHPSQARGAAIHSECRLRWHYPLVPTWQLPFRLFPARFIPRPPPSLGAFRARHRHHLVTSREGALSSSRSTLPRLVSVAFAQSVRTFYLLSGFPLDLRDRVQAQIPLHLRAPSTLAESKREVADRQAAAALQFWIPQARHSTPSSSCLSVFAGAHSRWGITRYLSSTPHFDHWSFWHSVMCFGALSESWLCLVGSRRIRTCKSWACHNILHFALLRCHASSSACCRHLTHCCSSALSLLRPSFFCSFIIIIRLYSFTDQPR